LAWAGGVYYSLGHLPVEVVTTSRAPEGEQSPRHDDIISAVRQMAEDVRALKAKVDGKDAVPKDLATSGQTTTGPTIADLVGRIDKLDAEVTAKLSQIDGQLASIQQRIPAPHPTVVARAQPPQKHVKHLHDAFDPSKDLNAPGVPRPLGSR
jgi:ribulose-5-phosphate 4-epimerase/fuculose-1-phosphate aldolase